MNRRKQKGSDSENGVEKERENGPKLTRVEVANRSEEEQRDFGLFQVDLITIAKSI